MATVVMTHSTDKPSAPAEPLGNAHDWHVYWKGIHDAGQALRSGATDPALAEFWERVFTTEFSTLRAGRVLDLACGDGAVTRAAIALSGKSAGVRIDSYCLDFSRYAVSETRKQYPDAMGIAADAEKMPFVPGAFNVVASQFGLEYAGPAAIGEVCRSLADNGLLACIVHKRNGSIFKECQAELEATRQFRNTDILELAENHFAAAFRMISKAGQRTEFEETGRALAPAVQRVESMLRARGKHAAGGLIHIIYQGLARINDTLREQTPVSVEGWIRQMRGELDAYAGRMASMLSAAFSEQDLKALLEKLKVEGMSVDSSDTLSARRTREVAAWTLICRKTRPG